MKLKNLKKKGTKNSDKIEQKVIDNKQVKQDEEEESELPPLVLLDEKNEFNAQSKKKEKTKAKVDKRIQSKLEEQQIDYSKIKQDKKVEVKPIKSWVPTKEEEKNLLKPDFKMQEQENQFESIYDEEINKKIQQVKNILYQKIANEPPKVKDIGGLKFAPLNDEKNKLISNTNETGTTSADPKKPVVKYVSLQANEIKNIPFHPEQQFVIGKKKEESTSISIIQGQSAKKFTNNNLKAQFAPLQKSSQQLKQQEYERKEQQRKLQQKAKNNSWIGNNFNKVEEKSEEVYKPRPQMNFMNSNKTQTFAPLQKSKQQLLMESKGQQNMVLQSKAEMEQRKKKREQAQKNGNLGVQKVSKTKVKVNVNQ